MVSGDPIEGHGIVDERSVGFDDGDVIRVYGVGVKVRLGVVASVKHVGEGEGWWGLEFVDGAHG